MTLLLPYRDDELADIAALVNSAYRGELAAKGWTSEATCWAASAPMKRACAPTSPPPPAPPS